jgi:hypothetical protein
VRSGTNEVENIDEEVNISEKLINDIVAMDAAFDPNQLPDLSVGIVWQQFLYYKQINNKNKSFRK